MAAAEQNDDDIISAINVTPLVDIVLVLLIILMVTANYVVSRSIPVDLPKAATGESTATTLAVSVNASGGIYLDTEAVTLDQLRQKVHAIKEQNGDPRVVIAADGRTPHADVIRVVDLLRQENVTKFAINVSPEALK